MYNHISIEKPSYGIKGIELSISGQRTTSIGCIASFTGMNDYKVTMTIDFTSRNISLQDYLVWCSFIKNIGLDFKIESTSENTLTITYPDTKHYSKIVGLLTLLRLPFYFWDANSHKIPSLAIEIFNKLGGRISEIEVILLAYYKAVDILSYLDGLHAIVGRATKFKEYNISDLDNGKSVNSIFESDVILSEKECSMLQAALAKEDYEAALTILK